MQEDCKYPLGVPGIIDASALAQADPPPEPPAFLDGAFGVTTPCPELETLPEEEKRKKKAD